jgi:hypothetical protein
MKVVTSIIMARAKTPVILITITAMSRVLPKMVTLLTMNSKVSRKRKEEVTNIKHPREEPVVVFAVATEAVESVIQMLMRAMMKRRRANTMLPEMVEKDLISRVISQSLSEKTVMNTVQQKMVLR